MRVPFPFALQIFPTAGGGPRQGSAMNSLRSALTGTPAGYPIHRSGRRGTTNVARGSTRQTRKSVYHVLGTKCLLCPGLDRLSSRHTSPAYAGLTAGVAS